MGAESWKKREKKREKRDCSSSSLLRPAPARGPAAPAVTTPAARPRAPCHHRLSTSLTVLPATVDATPPATHAFVRRHRSWSQSPSPLSQRLCASLPRRVGLSVRALKPRAPAAAFDAAPPAQRSPPRSAAQPRRRRLWVRSPRLLSHAAARPLLPDAGQPRANTTATPPSAHHQAPLPERRRCAFEARDLLFPDASSPVPLSVSTSATSCRSSPLAGAPTTALLRPRLPIIILGCPPSRPPILEPP